MVVFDAAWAAAWCEEINAADSYRQAGRSWSGALVLRMRAEPGRAERALYVDLQRGECLAARPASEQDQAEAPWVIEGTRETWRAVLAGRIDPILGLMQGRLRLERGNMLKLVPYARAAKVLLELATRVPATFPDD